MRTSIRTRIFTFSLILCNAVLWAQFEGSKSINKKFSTISVAPTLDKPIAKIDFLDPESDKKNFEKELEKILKKKRQEQKIKDLNKQGIITPKQLHKKKLKAEMKALSGNHYAKIDQDLGGFSSNSKNVTIVCRDFGAVDGDIVTIYLNDKPVVRQINLVQSFQRFTIPLKVGLNVISFKALNQGSSGPNTADFMVFDDKGAVLSSNQWNLATGAKAVLSIARDK